MTYLILEDATYYSGIGFGSSAPTIEQLKENKTTGELIFNTSMVGYQEIISDPSYEGQIVCFTYPHIGNYGIKIGDEENILEKKIHSKAIVVKEYYEGGVESDRITLNQYLVDNDIVGISGVNTRDLTIHLRDNGFKRATIIKCEQLGKAELDTVVSYLLAFPFISSLNPVENVSTKKIINNPQINTPFELIYNSKKHFALIDFGIKKSIIKALYKRGVQITLFPPSFRESEILSGNFDALFLSNGPGDPEMQTNAIQRVKELKGKLPILGICLGHQIITLAIGGTTEKMSFGHHGGNQPVTNLESHRTFVTSQNHSFVSSTLPEEAKIWFINSNDGSIEGIKVPEYKMMSVQFHPEAGPGPRESESIFDEFIKGAN